MDKSSLFSEIQAARDEMQKWPDWLRSAVQLEGTDRSYSASSKRSNSLDQNFDKVENKPSMK